MKKEGLSKGAKSRLMIIDIARGIYNTYGQELRIKDLSEKMEVNQSKLTNHFPTKELVIQAIFNEFQAKYAALIDERLSTDFTGFADFASFSSEVMDLNYHYRCAVLYYANVVDFYAAEKPMVEKQIEKKLEWIDQAIKNLIKKGELSAEAGEGAGYQLLVYQWQMLSIHWMNSLLRYEVGKSYEEMKPFYLKAMFSIFGPYLTKKGKKAFESLGF